jgi:hypothetical protein
MCPLPQWWGITSDMEPHGEWNAPAVRPICWPEVEDRIDAVIAWVFVALHLVGVRRTRAMT